MPNKTRPQHCGAAMAPLYEKTERGAWRKLPGCFHCRQCGALCRGRHKPRFMG